jgi:hypothetical protein
MSKSVVATLAAVATFAILVSAAVYAAGLGLKPGLWEVKMVKSVIDGHDNTAAVSGFSDRMTQMLASLPPDQRAQMEARLKQSGVSVAGDGGFRICVSAAMAKRDAPIVDKSGRCQPATVTHLGNQTNFAFNCSIDGRTTMGKGTATADGDVITTHVEMSSAAPGQASHVMENDSTMSFLGADCGDIKPADYVPPAQ